MVRMISNLLQNNTIKDLLALSRRIKELWVFGPADKVDPGAAAQAAQVRQDVNRVAELLTGFEKTRMEALAEESGAIWKSEVSTPDEPSQRAAGA